MTASAGSHTSSRCSGVELSVSRVGSAGPFEEAAGRAREAALPLGMLLEDEGAEPLLELIWMVTLRTFSNKCICQLAAEAHRNVATSTFVSLQQRCIVM